MYHPIHFVMLMFLWNPRIGLGIDKFDLFLQSPYIEGDPPGLQETYSDELSSRSSGAGMVLAGPGPYIGAAMERQRSVANSASASIAGRVALSDDPTSLPSKPLSMLLSAFQENLYNVIDDAINITLGGMNSEFSNQLTHCQRKLKICAQMPAIQDKCAAHCLSQASKFLYQHNDLIASQLEQLCLPVNSLFEKLFSLKRGNFQHFRSFRLFVEAFKESGRPLSEIAKYAAESLTPVIIDKVRTEYMPFRTVTYELGVALKEAEKQQSITDSIIFNRHCTTIDDSLALINLMDIFYRNPSLYDILTEGFAAMGLVTKYVPGPFQVPFASTVEAIRMLTGRICGLVDDSENPKSTCDQLGGFPVVGIPIPNELGIKPECTEEGNVGSSSSQGSQPGNTPGEVSGGNNEKPPAPNSEEPKESDELSGGSRKKRQEGVPLVLRYSQDGAVGETHNEKVHAKGEKRKKRHILMHEN